MNCADAETDAAASRESTKRNRTTRFIGFAVYAACVFGVQARRRKYSASGMNSPALLQGAQLDKHLGTFLRKTRGDLTFAEFSRRTGLPPSTLHRLESGEQSVTLGRLQQLMVRLRVRLADIYPAEWLHRRDVRK